MFVFIFEWGTQGLSYYRVKLPQAVLFPASTGGTAGGRAAWKSHIMFRHVSSNVWPDLDISSQSRRTNCFRPGWDAVSRPGSRFAGCLEKGRQPLAYMGLHHINSFGKKNERKNLLVGVVDLVVVLCFSRA